MTSLSPRKPRTTVRPRRRAATAGRLATLLAVLAAGGVAAGQYSGRPATPAPAGRAPAYPRAEAVFPASAAEPAQPLPLPIPVPERAAGRAAQQPDKQPDKKSGGEKPPGSLKQDLVQYIRLPERDLVFSLRGDLQLEQLVLDTLRQAEIRRQEELPPDKRRVDPVTGKPMTPAEAAYAVYPKTMGFPPLEPAGAGVAYVPKTGAYPPSRAYYASLHVVHRRLHFEDKNTERYGWDLGWIQPLASTLVFYRDVLLWPQSLGSGCASGFWDTNAGKCLPGSPTPYFLYPPGLTIAGGAFEGVIITGAAFALP